MPDYKAKTKQDLIRAIEILAKENEVLKALKGQEQAQIASEQYSEIYDFAPCGYFTFSQEGKILRMNLYGAKILGKERGLLMHKRFTSFVAREDVSEFNNFLERLFQEHNEQTCDIILQTDDRPSIFVHLTGITSENGKQCIVTAVDITQLKISEANLFSSEEKFNQLTQSSTSIVYRLLLKPELKFDYVSPSATEITGYTPEDHYADPQLGFKLVHPDDRILLENTTRYSQGEPLQLRWIRKDGRIIWTEQRNVLLFDKNMEPYAIEGNARDITEKKEAELLITKEVQRNKLLLDLFAQSPVISDNEIYNRALDIAVLTTDSKIGFMHQVSDDQKEIILTAWNDEAKKFCVTVSDNHYPIEKAGNWADCVRKREPLIYNNFSNSPNQKGLPQGHTPIVRTLVIPVLQEDKVHLIFGVGNKPFDYDNLDLIQIQAVADELHKILEKREIEKKLKKIEDHWQFAVEGSHDGLWDWNLLTSEVIFSNRWKEMLGYEAHEISGHLSEWQSRVHPDDIGMVLQKLQNHFEHRSENYSTEHRMLCKDGSWKWILDRGKVMEWTSDGIPVRMIGTHSDITERKNSEMLILEDQKIFQFLNELMSDYFFKLTRQDNGKFKMSIIAGNYTQATGRLLEESRDPDDWTEIIYADDLPILQNNFNQIIELRKPVSFKCRSFSAEGSLRWLEIIASPDLTSSSDKVTAIYGSVSNITNSMLLAEGLKESNLKYRNLADNGTALIWTSGTDKLCNYFNEPWLRFTGRRLEQEMGNGWAEGVHPDDFAECLRIYTTAFDKRERFEMDYRLRSASGEYRWIRDLGTPTFNSASDFTGYVGHCFDINEHIVIQSTLSFLLRCGLPGTGEDFFESLARYLAETLNMPGVKIGRFENDYTTLRTVAFFHKSRFEPNVCFHLRNTPYGELVQQGTCIYPDGVQQLFPDDPMLAKFQVVSFAGMALLDSKGNRMGILALVGDKPLVDTSKVESLLKLVAPRVSSELERRKAEDELNNTLAELNQANLLLEKRVAERTKIIQDISDVQKAILEHAGLAIICTSIDGTITVFNSAAEAMLGYQAHEVVGKASPLLFHDQNELDLVARKFSQTTNEVVESDFTLFRRILRKEHNPTGEWTYIGKGGDRFPVRLSIASIKDAENQVIGYIGIASDITHEKLSLAALKESEERFHNMFHEHSAVMLLIDPKTGKIIEANKSAERFYGYPFNIGAGLRISDLNIIPVGQLNNEIAKSMARTSNYFIFKHKLASGEIRTIETYSTPITVGGETVLFSIIHDITDRTKMEEALLKSESENRAIINAVPDLMFRISSDGTYLDFLSKDESLLFLSPEKFIGKKIIDVIPPEIALRSMAAIEQALLTGEVEPFEYLLKVQDKIQYFENRIIAISDQEVLSIIRDITLRKESEAKLNMQSAAFESFALSIIITDLEGRIQWANSAFTKLSGYSLNEVFGKSPGELIRSGVQNKDFYKNFWDTILSKKVWTGELTNRRKDGSLYFEEETITPVLDSQGNISGFIAIKIDITERKLLYQELATEKRRLDDIINGTNSGTWEWNVQTGETIFNEKWAEMIGYSLDEISPVSIDTWMKFAHPDDLKLSNNLLEKHFRGELAYYSMESRMKHKNGEWVWVLDRGKVSEWDDEGKPLLMSGTHQDVTDRKKVEELLSWNKSFLELMSNSSPMGFLVVDNRTDEILYFNHRFCEIWDLQSIEDRMRRGELKNNDIIPYCLPVLVDVPAFAESCKPLQSEDNRIVLEDEIAFTNNRTVRRFTTQIRGADDQYYGRFYIFEDITNRKNFEDELSQAKVDAEKASLAKSEFLSRMSHELRTPMNSILGFAQLMDMGELKPLQKKGVNHILANGKHLLDLINEVLDIAGIESGKQVLNLEPVALFGMISEVIDVLHILANKKEVTINFDNSIPNDLYCLADKLRLRQVMINLMDNAIKYNKSGGSVTISITMLPKESPMATSVKISISDTGNGITKEDISKLFQPFERIGADKTKTEGTGLGLMVVKKLTEAMGGLLGVESELGTGSTFWIELPIAKSTRTTDKNSSTFRIPELSADRRLATILYIEDNLSNIELVEEILTIHRPGVRLVTSLFGNKTIQLCKQYNPDLILLDLDLPDIHGYDVLKKLLANPQTKSKPVIIISADATPNQVSKLINSGAKSYLTKPLDIIQFLKSIDECLII